MAKQPYYQVILTSSHMRIKGLHLKLFYAFDELKSEFQTFLKQAILPRWLIRRSEISNSLF